MTFCNSTKLVSSCSKLACNRSMASLMDFRFLPAGRFSVFGRINPSVFYDLQKFHPAAWKHFRVFKEEKMQVFIEENLRRGIRQELYRKDLRVKVLAKLRIEEVEMGFNTAVFPSSKFNFTEVQVALLDHFLHGIVTLKGHKLINKYKEVIEVE